MIPLNFFSKLAIRPKLANATRSLAASGTLWKQEESLESLKRYKEKKEEGLSKDLNSHSEDKHQIKNNSSKHEDESDKGQEEGKSSQKEISKCPPSRKEQKRPEKRREDANQYMRDQSKRKDSIRSSEDQISSDQECCCPAYDSPKCADIKFQDKESLECLTDDSINIQTCETKCEDNSTQENTSESNNSFKKEECSNEEDKCFTVRNDTCGPTIYPKDDCPPLNKYEDVNYTEGNDPCEQFQVTQKSDCNNQKNECAGEMILVCHTQGENSRKRDFKEKCSEDPKLRIDACNQHILNQPSCKTICPTEQEKCLTKELRDFPCEQVDSSNRDTCLKIDSQCMKIKTQNREDPCLVVSSKKNVCEEETDNCLESNKIKMSDPCQKNKHYGQNEFLVGSKSVEPKTEQCPEKTNKDCIPQISPCCTTASAKACVCKLKELQKQWEEIIAFHESRQQNICPETKCQSEEIEPMLKKRKSNMIYVIIGAVLSAVIYYTYEGELEPEQLFLEEELATKVEDIAEE